MLLHIPQVLDAQTLAQCQQRLQQAGWADGRITAGTQSAQVKRNQQLPASDPTAIAIGQIILEALKHNALFFSAALPKQILPPLFNRYQSGMDFGSHVDNAVRHNPISGEYIRTDLSCTLFLAEPDSYEGGELVIEDTYGTHAVKLPAGDMILYPSSSLHHVTPVTQGERVASFFWLQSMIKDTEKRRLLFEMDITIQQLRHKQGDTAELITLTGIYHNLLRTWVEM